MHKFLLFCLGLWVCAWAGAAQAETFQLNDGQTVTGEMVSFNENGLILRTSDGKYADRIPWGKFSQADLRTLAENPKVAPFVEPFIEITQEEIIKKTEVPIKPVERLDRPAPQSLFGALFSSGVGIFTLLLLYAANIYAGYEVAVFRARPVALVCGVSAVLPVLGPIIFLSMPTRLSAARMDEQEAGAPPLETPTYAVPAATAAESAAEDGAGGLRLAQTKNEGGGAAAAAQVFPRGQYTFNRRFIETKFSGFFGTIRRGAEQDLVLVFKTGRGEFVANRITRIAAGDLHAEVLRGGATEEMMISFPEIQEIHLRHKHA